MISENICIYNDNKEIDNNILVNIYNLLIEIWNTENSIFKKIKDESNKENILYCDNYYLIDNIFISQYKVLFSYNIIYDYIFDKKYENDIENKLFNKQKDILESLFKNDKEKIFTLFKKDINEYLNIFQDEQNNDYSKDFYIINDYSFNYLNNIAEVFNNNIIKKEVHKIRFFIKEGKIIINIPELSNIFISNFIDDKKYFNCFKNEIIIKYYSSYEANKQFEELQNYKIKKFFKFNKQINPIHNKNKEIIGNLYVLKYGPKKIIFNNNDKEKLKTILKLLIYYEKFVKENNNYNEKLFLININWLNQYGIDKIQNEINQSNEFDKIIKSNSFDFKEKLKKIVNILDSKYNIIKEFEEKLNNNIEIKEEFFYEDMENIILSKNKIIKIINNFNNFILVNKYLFEKFSVTFNLKDILPKIKYYNYKKEKNIIVFKSKKQNTILIGNEYGDINNFDLKFILNYNSKDYLKKESEKIFDDYKSYFKKYIFLEKYYISPIIKEEKDIIGYCYKYNITLLNNNSYSYYMINEILINLIKLYIYYIVLNQKITKNTNEDNKLPSDEYYLVNENWLKDYKVTYNFDKINEELNNNQNAQKIINDYIIKNNNYKEPINLKNIFLIINELSPSINIEINHKNNNEKKNINDNNFIPNIINLNYYDNLSQLKLASLKAFNNFEILNKKIIELFSYEKFESNYSKCYIIDNYILINFGNNKNENEQIFSLIGVINYKNIFITKYLLTYKKEKYRDFHVKLLKKHLSSYLNNLQLLYKSQPIINYDYKIIGNLAKIDEDNNDIKSLLSYDNNNGNIIKNSTNDNEMIFDDLNLYYKKSDEVYGLDNSNNNLSIKNNFISCPHIGLTNIGATCYMNATLQCFCHIKKFVDYFKYNPYLINTIEKDKNNLSLSSSFRLLIENLWPNNYNPSSEVKYYAPEEFKKKISKMNPLFDGIAANDSKDLVNFIIMQLHQELNKAKDINTNIVIDQTNKQVVFNYFFQNFKENNKSIISDLFYSINCNVTECCNCNTKIYNFQIYFFLIFPLEEIRKFKNETYYNNLNNNNFNNNLINNEVSIYDCFNYDRKKNFMSGENSMYCNYCKVTYSSIMYTYLVTSPEILIILLNRGNGIEFNVKINFEEYISLYNYIEYKENGFNYRLIGVITHIGESSMSGHFIAYCRDPITEKWYKYNDAIVNEVIDFQEEVINFADPYLLFYQKINKNLE